MEIKKSLGLSEVVLDSHEILIVKSKKTQARLIVSLSENGDILVGPFSSSLLHVSVSSKRFEE